MPVPPRRSEIRAGQNVSIETKQNQGTGRLTDGAVRKILTSADSHPHGIKVELDGGQVGRVKRIVGRSGTAAEPEAVEPAAAEPATVHGRTPSFPDLDRKEIPKVEDKYNEFKEFYQYDPGIEQMPQDLPRKQRLRIIDDRKAPVRERMVTAVCSMGNDSHGGFVYLGVRDDGTVVGLERDLKLGGFSDYEDKFANHIHDTLVSILQDEVFVTSRLQIKFTRREGATVCIMAVLPAEEPLFVHVGDAPKFFIRGSAPRAVRLKGRSMIRYCRSRFPGYG